MRLENKKEEKKDNNIYSPLPGLSDNAEDSRAESADRKNGEVNCRPEGDSDRGTAVQTEAGGAGNSGVRQRLAGAFAQIRSACRRMRVPAGAFARIRSAFRRMFVSEEAFVRIRRVCRRMRAPAGASARVRRTHGKRRVLPDGTILVVLSGVVLAVSAFFLSPADMSSVPESSVSHSMQPVPESSVSHPVWEEGGAADFVKAKGDAAVSSGQEDSLLQTKRESLFSAGGIEAGVFFPASELLHAVAGAQGNAAACRNDVEQSLREQYYALLESGRTPEFAPSGEAQRRIWEEVREERKKSLEKDPLLILVNRLNYLPEGYKTEPVSLENGQMISRECYEPLEEMLADCREAGGTPIVCSGYRPHWYQEDLFEAQINRWIYAGYGQEESRALAATAVAVPGTSEHELGLAADIYSSENTDLDESQVNTFTQKWLMENSWRYGFILRYPEHKSDITGIIFEPWHYRYVGTENAKKIFDSGLCLEEYLDRVETME